MAKHSFLQGLFFSAALAASSIALAEDSPVGLVWSGSIHGKGEVATWDADGEFHGLALGPYGKTNNRQTNFEAFLNADAQTGPNSEVHVVLPLSALPYAEIRYDLTQAYFNHRSAGGDWEVDLGRFGTPFSLEKDELARTSFANHGLLWGEIYFDPSERRMTVPFMVPPRGLTGLRVARHWLKDTIRTEMIFSLPEPASKYAAVAAEPPHNTGIGARLEWKLADTARLTAGGMALIGSFRDALVWAHLGAEWQIRKAEFSAEALASQEHWENADNETETFDLQGVALRGSFPLTENWSTAARVEYASYDRELLCTLAFNQRVTPQFDIRYQLEADLETDGADNYPYDYQLALSGSMRF